MAEIRGDGAQRRRRRRFRSHPNRTDYGVDNFNAGYSEEFSIPSHTDDTSHGRRNTALDDALFGFFMKQFLYSMKRNYSDFCQDSLGNNESKKNKLDGVERSFFSKFGLKYFFPCCEEVDP